MSQATANAEILPLREEEASLVDRLRRRAKGDDKALSDAGDVEKLVRELASMRNNVDLNDGLRRHQAALMALTRSEAIGSGSLVDALGEITEVAAKILGVQRSSVWRYNDDESKIVCMDLYVEGQSEHAAGIELSKVDFPRYFEALRTERAIVAVDAHTDPNTSEFSEVYLTPLGVGAMLDAPVRVGGRMVGLICNEYVGGSRVWSTTEIHFASALADFTALAFESSQRRRTEAELRDAIRLAEESLQTIERQRMAIADLSAPIIDVWDDILALPIVGLVDTQRSVEVTERLLGRISSSGARAVIVDLTGVDVVDTMTANHLLQMIRAAGLLGAHCVLSGISPQIAQTLVQLDVDLSEMDTVRNLKEALRLCLAKTGRKKAQKEG